MEYTLDFSMKDTTNGEDILKRAHLVRPLSHVEIVPMPYVTENSRVNLILPVTAADRDGVVSFLDSYAHTCLDSGDNTDLFVIFIYDPLDSKENKDDIFAVLKSMITYYENKYQNGARIAWTSIHTAKPSQFTIMDTISKKFPPESLFFLCTVGMELSIEFLNRVRMNTIANWQVFFPVGFWQYKPNLIYDDKPYPTTIEINKNVGHFDRHSYYHTGFYNSDYTTARKKMKANTPKDKSDLFDLFLKFHNVHVFRAVEPALKHRYRPKNCKPTLEEDAYQRCLQSRAEGLASRAQLAMLIFEHQKTLDQGHLNVIHKQNDPHIEQMKPNMLK